MKEYSYFYRIIKNSFIDAFMLVLCWYTDNIPIIPYIKNAMINVGVLFFNNKKLSVMKHVVHVTACNFNKKRKYFQVSVDIRTDVNNAETGFQYIVIKKK